MGIMRKEVTWNTEFFHPKNIQVIFSWELRDNILFHLRENIIHNTNRNKYLTCSYILSYNFFLFYLRTNIFNEQKNDAHFFFHLTLIQAKNRLIGKVSIWRNRATATRIIFIFERFLFVSEYPSFFFCLQKICW